MAADSAREAHQDYRNPELSGADRVEDLLGRMTLAEKAGTLFQTMIVVGSGDLSASSSAFWSQQAPNI
jgi:beta-glucosidase